MSTTSRRTKNELQNHDRSPGHKADEHPEASGRPKVVVENLDPKPNGATQPKAKKPRKNGDTLLTMTGKKPQKNSQLAKALDVFEKLEKRVGIGSVTKNAFKAELIKKKLPKTLCQRCITEKVLGFLE